MAFGMASLFGPALATSRGPQSLQTERGIGQAKGAGKVIREYIEREGEDNRLYFYMSPYKRSLQTFEALASNFSREQIQGCQEEVQLREQDFGNFQVSSQLYCIVYLELAILLKSFTKDVQGLRIKAHCREGQTTKIFYEH